MEPSILFFFEGLCLTPPPNTNTWGLLFFSWACCLELLSTNSTAYVLAVFLSVLFYVNDHGSLSLDMATWATNAFILVLYHLMQLPTTITGFYALVLSYHFLGVSHLSTHICRRLEKCGISWHTTLLPILLYVQRDFLSHLSTFLFIVTRYHCQCTHLTAYFLKFFFETAPEVSQSLIDFIFEMHLAASNSEHHKVKAKHLFNTIEV